MSAQHRISAEGRILKTKWIRPPSVDTTQPLLPSAYPAMSLCHLVWLGPWTEWILWQGWRLVHGAQNMDFHSPRLTYIHCWVLFYSRISTPSSIWHYSLSNQPATSWQQADYIEPLLSAERKSLSLTGILLWRLSSACNACQDYHPCAQMPYPSSWYSTQHCLHRGTHHLLAKKCKEPPMPAGII